MKDGSSSILTHARADSRVPLLPYADSSSSSPTARSLSKRYMTCIPKRRSLIALLSLTVLSLVAFSFTFLGSPDVLNRVPGYTHTVPPSLDADLSSDSGDASSAEPATDPETPPTYLEDLEDDEPAHSPYVLGPPTPSFRDNLRNDTKYITSWISAGWSVYPTSPTVHV